MKTPIIGIIAIFVLGVVTAGAYAFGPMFHNQDVQNALEQDDYNAFQTARAISEDQFHEFAQMHRERQAERKSMHEAISAGDYSAWQEAIKKKERLPPCYEDINENNFDQFVEMHNARANRDFETANEIAKELGIEQGHHGRGGFKKNPQQRQNCQAE